MCSPLQLQLLWQTSGCQVKVLWNGPEASVQEVLWQTGQKCQTEAQAVSWHRDNERRQSKAAQKIEFSFNNKIVNYTKMLTTLTILNLNLILSLKAKHGKYVEHNVIPLSCQLSCVILWSFVFWVILSILSFCHKNVIVNCQEPGEPVIMSLVI